MSNLNRRMSHETIRGIVNTLLKGTTERSAFAAGVKDLHSALSDLFFPADVLQVAYGLIFSASTHRSPYNSNHILLEEYACGVSTMAFMLCRVHEDINLLLAFKEGLRILNLPYLVSA